MSVRWIAWAGIVSASAGLTFPVAPAWTAPPSGPGAVVLVTRAVSSCFSDVIRVTGFLVPREEAMVRLDADGYRVAEILVAEGDRVKAGQDLVRLARVDMPGAPDSSPPGRPQAAPAAPPAAVTLRAPAAGLITRSTAVVGAVASLRAEPLFRIMINDELELEVDVPSIHVPKFKRDGSQTARVEVEDGTRVGGRVRLAPAEIDRMTQLGRARLSIDRAPTLRVGMFSRAMIDASRSCGIAVPRSAVNYQADVTTVQVVRDAKVETRRVRIGLLSDSSVEIREGVKEGEIVVANAGTSLEDGDHVKPIFSEQLDK
jgi:multidrug efflux pump subunit AcrA (membrane-fusion protein)